MKAVNAGYKYEVQAEKEGFRDYFSAAIGAPIPGTLEITRETLNNVRNDWRNIVNKQIASFSSLQWAAWTGTVQAVAPFTTGIVQVPYSLLGGTGVLNCFKFAVVAGVAAIAEAKIQL